MEKKLRDAIIRLENFAKEYEKLCDQSEPHSDTWNFFYGKAEAYKDAAKMLRNNVLGEYDDEND